MDGDLVGYAGTLVGGIAGGVLFGWTWMKKLAAKGVDAEALRQLKAVEHKNEEAHRQFDERLRVLEIETARQKGVLQQINERLGEILGILRVRGAAT